MSPRLIRTVLRAACLCAAVVLLTGCEDMPNSPRLLKLLADGEEWVAIAPPEGLPDLAQWAPYAGESVAEGKAASARVRALQRRADRLRAAGNVAEAAELRREAVRITAGALARTPQQQTIRTGLAAVDLWMQRVQQGAALPALAELQVALDSVGAGRNRAALALAAGDTLDGVGQLIEVGEQIRRWAPAEVALRVLDRAERRLQESERSPSDVERARHLIRSARQELAKGDPVRVLQRALYALQIAGGSPVSDMRSEDEGCAPQGC